LPNFVHLGAMTIVAAALTCVGRASAQSSPSPSPSPSTSPKPTTSTAPAPAPSASATPFKLITLSGYGDAGFTTIGLTDQVRFVNGTPSRIFDGANGAFFDANGGRQLATRNDFNDTLNLQNANVQLLLNGSVVSGKLEGSFGSDADVIASNGQSRSGSNLTQAYLQAVRGPLTLIVGKFSSLAGAEVIEAPNNTNFSRSYLFGDAVPFTHTGARLTYAYNSKVSLIVGANNGWDDWKFAGKKKTLEGAIVLTPSPGYALTLDTYNGNDFALNGVLNGALTQYPVVTNRMLYDGVLTVHPTSALTIIANYDNGTQLGDGINTGPLAFATAHWNGIAGYANYQFNSRYGVSLRKESFGDTQGFRTGIPQRLQSNTATINFTPGSNYIFRIEYRLDASDRPSFTYRGYNPATDMGRNHQSSLGVETVVKFP